MKTIEYVIIDGKVESEWLLLLNSDEEVSLKKMEVIELLKNHLLYYFSKDKSTLNIRKLIFNSVNTFSRNKDISFKRIYLN